MKIVTDQKGWSLILVFLIVIVIFVVGTTLVQLVVTESKISNNHMDEVMALHLADGGINMFLARANETGLETGYVFDLNKDSIDDIEVMVEDKGTWLEVRSIGFIKRPDSSVKAKKTMFAVIQKPLLSNAVSGLGTGEALDITPEEYGAWQVLAQSSGGTYPGGSVFSNDDLMGMQNNVFYVSGDAYLNNLIGDQGDGTEEHNYSGIGMIVSRGDIYIGSNLVPESSIDALVLVSEGDLLIGDGVTDIQGIFISEGSYQAGDVSDSITLTGSVIAQNIGSGRINIIYDGHFLELVSFELPGKDYRAVEWREFYPVF